MPTTSVRSVPTRTVVSVSIACSQRLSSDDQAEADRRDDRRPPAGDRPRDQRRRPRSAATTATTVRKPSSGLMTTAVTTSLVASVIALERSVSQFVNVVDRRRGTRTRRRPGRRSRRRRTAPTSPIAEHDQRGADREPPAGAPGRGSAGPRIEPLAGGDVSRSRTIARMTIAIPASNAAPTSSLLERLGSARPEARRADQRR